MSKINRPIWRGSLLSDIMWVDVFSEYPPVTGGEDVNRYFNCDGSDSDGDNLDDGGNNVVLHNA